MEVEYVQTVDDYVVFNRHHQTSQPWWRRQWRMVYIGLAMLALTVFLFVQILPSFDANPPPDRVAFADQPGFVLGFLGFALLFPLSMFACALALSRWVRPFFLRMQVRRLVTHPQNRMRLLGWRRCSLGPDALAVHGKEVSLTLAWPAIQKIAEGEEHAFFYTTTQEAMILPRRPFPNDRAFRDFVAAARRYHVGGTSGGKPDGGVWRKPPGQPDTNVKRDEGGNLDRRAVVRSALIWLS